jgi:hypothetical protein
MSGLKPPTYRLNWPVVDFTPDKRHIQASHDSRQSRLQML